MSGSSDPRSQLFGALERAVEDRVFPGCVALVWRDGELLYHEAHGALATQAGLLVTDVPVQRDTVYDLASLTKVLCTTSLTAIAVGQGRLSLDDEVPAPFHRACPGARLVELLEHCAGLPAHREFFLEVPFGDRAGLLELLGEARPTHPPRERAVYSDLGFIILGAWLERVLGGSLDDVFDRHVAGPLGCGGAWVDALAFRPVTGALIARDEAACIAPTEVYASDLHAHGVPSWFPVRASRRCAHGEVHDDNAYVMGGVAGHAGLFGNAHAVLTVARAWLDLALPGLDIGLRTRFWTKSKVPASTRRLGWDGQSPDGSGSSGGALGPRAVGHTGYTGTSLWLDPDTREIYVLLSNRVHPTRGNDAIQSLRRWFHQLARRL